MNDILNFCNQKLIELPCCHERKTEECNCSVCLRAGFYDEPDNYECYKKLCYYVLNYGPSYASELYHYLSLSKILETYFNKKTINVLSLGCGYAPDLIVLKKYISEKKLQIKIIYTGIDQASSWSKLRKNSENIEFIEKDILTGFDLSDFDIVFMIKLFSTLYKNKMAENFIKLLSSQIENNLKENAYLIFNDVNSIYMGRDIFHIGIRNLFSSCKQYYLGNPPFIEQNWVEIQDKNLAFPLPCDLEIVPLKEITNTVVFEYRK